MYTQHTLQTQRSYTFFCPLLSFVGHRITSVFRFYFISKETTTTKWYDQTLIHVWLLFGTMRANSKTFCLPEINKQIFRFKVKFFSFFSLFRFANKYSNLQEIKKNVVYITIQNLEEKKVSSDVTVHFFFFRSFYVNNIH